MGETAGRQASEILAQRIVERQDSKRAAAAEALGIVEWLKTNVAQAIPRVNFVNLSTVLQGMSSGSRQCGEEEIVDLLRKIDAPEISQTSYGSHIISEGGKIKVSKLTYDMYVTCGNPAKWTITIPHEDFEPKDLDFVTKQPMGLFIFEGHTKMKDL